MMELQQKLHDIARKGSDTPFDAYRQRRTRKRIAPEQTLALPRGNSKTVQLSLFQNR